MTASIILLVLAAMELGIYLAKHGEHKTGKYNFWIGLLSVAIYLVLYYYFLFLLLIKLNLLHELLLS